MTTPFTFALVADPQLGIREIVSGKGNWDAELAHLNEAVEKINGLATLPKFTVFLGDLVHAFPGQEYREQQVVDFTNAVSKLTMPVKLMSGNHDLGQIPTADWTEQYKEEFKTPDFYDFIFDNLHVVITNSQPLKANQQYESHLKWLRETLSKNPTHKKVVCMHIPPFVGTLDEEDRWDNLPKSTRQQVLEIFEEFNVSWVFTGHCHRTVSQKPLLYKSTKIASLPGLTINLDIKVENGKFISCTENKNDPLAFFVVHVDENGTFRLEKHLIAA